MLLVYGANGYTGRLIAQRLAELGIDAMLAGRSERAVADVAEATSLPYRTFGLDDSAHIDSGIDGAHAVLNCAGPFVRTARPLADACMRRGAHYLDITGEIAAFEALAACDADAQRAGVMLLPGVGFDVVPSDCLAAHLAAQMPDAVKLTLAIRGTGRLSHGTASTMVENAGGGGLVRRGGRLVRVPAGWRTRSIDFGDGPQKAITIPWGDVATAWYSTGIPDVEVYAAAPAAARVALRASRWLGPLLRTELLRNAQIRRIRSGPAGPSARELEHGTSTVWGEVVNGAGDRSAARLHGPNGYRMTVDAAVEIARRTMAGQFRAGFQTPSRAFGAHFVLELPGVRREAGG